jgi:hypothetical protein
MSFLLVLWVPSFGTCRNTRLNTPVLGRMRLLGPRPGMITCCPIHRSDLPRECDYGDRNGASIDTHMRDRSRDLDEPYPAGENWRQAGPSGLWCFCTANPNRRSPLGGTVYGEDI